VADEFKPGTNPGTIINAQPGWTGRAMRDDHEPGSYPGPAPAIERTYPGYSGQTKEMRRPRPAHGTGHRWLAVAVVAALFTIGCGIGAVSVASHSIQHYSLSDGSPTPAAAPAPTSGHSKGATAPTAKSTPLVALKLSGSGGKTTKTFTTSAEWTIKYSFDCKNFGQAGNFQIMSYTSGDLTGLPVNELAKKGSSTTYQHGDPGRHYLEVNSECSWHLEVDSVG